MRVGITGASGLIGSALAQDLQQDGHEVVRFVRREAAPPGEVTWQPGGVLDPAVMDGLDAVVNLAGAGVGDHRWTPQYKETIRSSRVGGTATLARAMTDCANPPSVFVSGSAIGYYGDTGDRLTDESGPMGTSFLAEVVDAWEAAAAPPAEAGVRVATARTGLVVAAHGGAWERLLPLFRLGLGGRMGSGRQYWSTISLRDEVRALRFLLDEPVSGPVNLVGPHPAPNAEVTKVMGSVLKRPTLLPVPGFALRAAIGEFAEETLVSQRIDPRVLRQAGFEWLDGSIADQIRAATR